MVALMASHKSLALTSGLIGLASLITYLLLIVGEGNNSIGQVAPWALLFGVPSGSALWAARQEGSQARAALLVSATVFSAIGIVAILSIGALFLGAGVAAAIAAMRVSSTDETDSV